jgi:glycosyltransferase involved in cell wall biosynthesis
VRILFCSSAPWVRDLGGPKVLVELAAELEKLGWACDKVCLPDLAPSRPRGQARQPLYAAALRAYLREHAGRYDVIDYDHVYLPYPRSDFAGETLFVARSVLLQHQVASVRPSKRKTGRALAGALLKGASRRRELAMTVRLAHATLAQADLVNVSNDDAKKDLIDVGLPPQKLVVLPYGLSRRSRALFRRVPSEPPGEPLIGFVGTFDFRKGAMDFPQIVERIVHWSPSARFRLVGTKGMFKTQKQVLLFFPRSLRSRIEVVPRFHPDELAELLAPCAIGVFPSYVEGFPFGVLEMLAASMPVIAYRSPGAPMMLPHEYLVEPGDVGAMSRKVVALLHDESVLADARAWARRRSEDFSWQPIAAETARVYTEALGKRRAA